MDGGGRGGGMLRGKGTGRREGRVGEVREGVGGGGGGGGGERAGWMGGGMEGVEDPQTSFNMTPFERG